MLLPPPPMWHKNIPHDTVVHESGAKFRLGAEALLGQAMGAVSSPL